MKPWHALTNSAHPQTHQVYLTGHGGEGFLKFQVGMWGSKGGEPWTLVLACRSLPPASRKHVMSAAEPGWWIQLWLSQIWEKGGASFRSLHALACACMQDTTELMAQDLADALDTMAAKGRWGK